MADRREFRDDRGDRSTGNESGFNYGRDRHRRDPLLRDEYWGGFRGDQEDHRERHREGHGGGHGAEYLPPWYGTGYAGAGFYGGPYNGPSGDTGWRGGPEYNAAYGGYGAHGVRGSADYGAPNQRERSPVPGGNYAGRGPRNYRRSDERIREDVSEELTRHPGIDASEIDVHVQDGEVTLSGTVRDRDTKYLAEDVAESCAGVTEVRDELRVEHPGPRGARHRMRDREVTHRPASDERATGTSRGRGAQQTRTGTARTDRDSEMGADTAGGSR